MVLQIVALRTRADPVRIFIAIQSRNMLTWFQRRDMDRTGKTTGEAAIITVCSIPVLGSQFLQSVDGGYPPQQRPRPGPGAGGYYRNSSYGMRPEAFAEEPALPQPPYGRPPRQQGPSHYANGESSSPPGHSYQQSYETMTSGSEDYGKSTNPSSQNSSFDRLHQMHGRKPDEYGHYDEIQPVQPPNGYGQYPQYGGYQNQNPNMNGYANGQINGQMNGQMQRGGPMPPAANNPRIPIKLTTSNSGPPPTMADLNKELPAKRQSWFKRKISRRDS